MNSFVKHPLCPEFGRAKRLGLSLTDGYFWPLIAGGHILYRSAPDENVIDYIIPVGFVCPESTTINNFSYISHRTNSTYKYGLRAVSICGIEEENTTQITTVEFDVNGDLILPHPNFPFGLVVEPLSKTQTKLVWRYDPTGEQVAPNKFNVYVDDIYNTSINYQSMRRLYSTVVTHNYDSLHKFRIRALSLAGQEDNNTIDRYATYDSDAPPTPVKVIIVKESDE